MDTSKARNLEKIIAPTIAFIVIVGLWEFIARGLSVPLYLLPPPSTIAADIVMNIPTLIFHAGITLWEAMLGFFFANLIAIVVAVIFAHSQAIQRGLYPYAIALKTTPIIAMAPLLVLWFGNGIWSKVAAAALISFFPTIVNATRGFKAITQEELDLFRGLSATKWQVFTKLRLPAALPFIFSALKISSSLAVVGAIVGEFVGANRGIGFLILISSYHLETISMFSAVIMAAVIGVVLFGIISVLEKKYVFWTNVEND